MKGNSQAVSLQDKKCQGCGEPFKGKVSHWKKFCFECKYKGKKRYKLGGKGTL